MSLVKKKLNDFQLGFLKRDRLTIEMFQCPNDQTVLQTNSIELRVNDMKSLGYC